MYRGLSSPSPGVRGWGSSSSAAGRAESASVSDVINSARSVVANRRQAERTPAPSPSPGSIVTAHESYQSPLAVQNEIARVRKAANKIVSPPSRGSAAGLNETPPAPPLPLPLDDCTSSGTAAGGTPADAVSQLHLALSSRESRTNRLLAEKEGILAQKERENAELRADLEELREMHGMQMSNMEAKAAALQRQVQKAICTDAKVSPNKRGMLEMEQMYRHAAHKVEKSEEEAARLAEALKRANELLHDAQDELNEERLKRAQIVSTTRGELRKELEQAHLDIVDKQREEFEEELREREQSSQRMMDRFSRDLEQLRMEFVTVENDREAATRETKAATEEVARLRMELQAATETDGDTVDQLRSQLNRTQITLTDLKAVNKRLQAREGALEARIVELELAAGLAQEEAAGEERMKAAAELQDLQERHRTQARRDAEELGRLRGMLSASEAKLELNEEISSSLGQKLDLVQRQIAEMEAARNTAANQVDVRSMELVQAEAKVSQLEKNLAENRALLGRQAGQLQASQDRAGFLEGRLKELEQKLDETERELAAVAAESSEAKTTLRLQATELQESRQTAGQHQDKVTAAARRASELEGEVGQARTFLEATKTQLQQAEDRCLGLEAALAQQASNLRAQLQVDAESAYALKLTRERTEWEAVSMEQHAQLEIACQRRRRQACLASQALGVTTSRVRLSSAFTALKLYAGNNLLQQSRNAQKKMLEEIDVCVRREKSLQDELDMVACESVLHKNTEFHNQAVGNLLQKATYITCLGDYFARWAGLGKKRALVRQKHKAALAFAWESCKLLQGVAYRKWQAWVRTRRSFNSQKKRELGNRAVLSLASSQEREQRSRIFSLWRVWVSGRVLVRDELRSQRYGVLSNTTFEDWRVSMLRHRYYGMLFRWACFQQMRSLARKTSTNEAEFRGQQAELERTIASTAEDHAELAARYNESLETNRTLLERCQRLDRGLVQARTLLATETKELSDKTIDLEAERSRLETELITTREQLSRWREQATFGIRAETEKVREHEQHLEDQVAALKESVQSTESSKEAVEAELADEKKLNGDMKRQLQEAEDRACDLQGNLQSLQHKYDQQLNAPRTALSTLELRLKEAGGRVATLEEELEGRTQDQYRLGADLEAATASLVQETERRKMVDRALREVKETCGKQAKELVQQVVTLDDQLRTALTENESYRGKNDQLELEVAELRGRVEQVERIRLRLGPAADYVKVPEGQDDNEEVRTLRQKNQHLEQELRHYQGRLKETERSQHEADSMAMQQKIETQAMKIAELYDEMQNMREGYEKEKSAAVAEVSSTGLEEDLQRLLDDKSDENMQLQNRLRAVQNQADVLTEEVELKDSRIKEMEDAMQELQGMVSQRETLPSSPTIGAPSPPGVAVSPTATPPLSPPENSERALSPGNTPASPVISEHLSPDPPPPASPTVEPSESAPPASPPSPFGRSKARRMQQQQQQQRQHVSSLSDEEQEKLRWIFAYGDADGDGHLNFAELQKLSTDTSGGLDTEQYDTILDVLSAPPQGLQIQHLERLYLELGSPGDVDDNYEALTRLKEEREKAEAAPPPIRSDAPSSPAALVSATSKVRPETSSPYGYGKTGSLPFKVAMPTKADPDPVVTVSTTHEKSLAKGALILEVTNQSTLTTTRIATRDQFLQTTSPQHGVFEGTQLTLKVTTDSQTITRWKGTHKAEYGRRPSVVMTTKRPAGRKKVYPHVPKNLVEEVTVTVGPLTTEARDARVKRISEKLTMHKSVDKGSLDTQKLFLLMHDPEVLKPEAALQAAVATTTGIPTLHAVLAALERLCGFPAPSAAQVAPVPEEDGFNEVWPAARKAYLNAFDGEVGGGQGDRVTTPSAAPSSSVPPPSPSPKRSRK